MNWIQNSVFEGELTEAQLMKIKKRLNDIIDNEEDSVIIFTSRDKKWLSKSVIGREKNQTDNFV